jgi:hypothetical protein
LKVERSDNTAGNELITVDGNDVFSTLGIDVIFTVVPELIITGFVGCTEIGLGFRDGD